MKCLHTYLSDTAVAFLKRYPGVSRIIKPFASPLYRRVQSYLEKRRNFLFRKNAAKTLSDFDECMKSNSFEYCLAFGSLLGAIREKGFIKHDLDLDVTMWAEDYSPHLVDCLRRAGFKVIRELRVQNGSKGREMTFIKNGVSIDIFFLYPAIDRYPYFCDFKPFKSGYTLKTSMDTFQRIIARRIQIPISKERTTAIFEGYKFPVPVNARKVLEARYGKDYMIPNPNWDESMLEKGTIVYWDDEIATYID